MSNENIEVSAIIGMEAWTGGPRREKPFLQKRPNTQAPYDREQDMAMIEVEQILLVKEITPLAKVTTVVELIKE